jgi:hypothetical protein
LGKNDVLLNFPERAPDSCYERGRISFNSIWEKIIRKKEVKRVNTIHGSARLGNVELKT